jgi:PKD repeat protein
MYRLSFSQSAIEPRTCATMEQDSINRAHYPQRGTLSDFEFELQSKIKEIQSRNKGKRIQATLLTIPVVFHIVHNGEPVGSGTNLSAAQVQSQIAVLNEDFRKLQGTPGYNDNPVGADIEIEFCLSPLDANGVTLAEPGIHRYNGNKASWTRAEIENQLKPITIWNPNLFYNVWSLKFSTAEANLLGYAQFPDQSGLTGLPASGPASTDGVVVRYQSIGSAAKGNFPVMEAPYNRGRTLTHETGHWLGLRHIWGDGNCADDFVNDTPPASGPSSGCPTGRVSCGGPNMVENYMDYSYDACMNIFTQGQKVRMLAVMEVSPRRKTLTQASLCSPQVADIPTADFSVDRQQVLKGGEASFTDLSSNFPNEWVWTFEGGDPAASTERNPRIKYETPGTYRVILIAKNALGESVPRVREGYIQVSEEGLCGKFSNYSNAFTPSTLSISGFAPYTGYLTGHNSSKTKAISEYFRNDAGYEYINSVTINFAEVTFASEDAYVYVTVWNARGPQNAPGSVIERKLVLLKQIKEDIENNRATTVVFDRETPVLNRPFQVGIELEYTSGAKIAITSSANGEALNATSWIQNENGQWNSYAIAFGANIAMDIQPSVGMNPSVQVSSSKPLVYPGEEVTLNGRGASIFVWESLDGKISDFAGPQLKFSPQTTTTILTIGSGLDLCVDSTYTTIYVRENIVGVDEIAYHDIISVFPNPGDSNFIIQVQGEHRGPVYFEIFSSTGQQKVISSQFQKVFDESFFTVNTSEFSRGIYLVRIRIDKDIVVKKWIKL